MLKEIEDGDWSEAFKYAMPERALPNDLDVSLDPFEREDVASIIAMVEGENDGDDWLIVGRLVGYPTFTHMFGDREFADKLKELVRSKFEEICATK